MTKVKLSVRLSQSFDERAIAEGWAEEVFNGLDVTVDESTYIVNDITVNDPDLESDHVGESEITFTVELDLERQEGKFISKSDLADALMDLAGGDYDSDHNGSFSVEMEET